MCEIEPRLKKWAEALIKADQALAVADVVQPASEAAIHRLGAGLAGLVGR